MKTKHLLAPNITALIAFIVLSVSSYASPPQYAVTILGSASGAAGVNDSGQVTGSSQGNAALWNTTASTVVRNLYGGGFGYGINASGQVAFDAGAGAMIWDGTTATSLNSPVAGSSSAAYAINSSGWIAGYAVVYSFVYYEYIEYACVWEGGTSGLQLGGINNAPSGTNNYSVAYGINTSGQVTGQIPGTYGTSAVVWTGSTQENLGTLGGTSSCGYGINDSGQVVGYSQTTGNAASHAVLWTGTTPKDLGTLGGSNSYGYGINASGEMDGMSQTSGNAANDPFLYSAGTMYDLNSLLVNGSGISGLTISQYGNSINDGGQIAATGTINGVQDALLLTPVATPEPASGLLLLGSGLMLGLWRRREPADCRPRPRTKNRYTHSA